MLLCLLLPTLLYIWTVREPPPPWRAAYYGNERFEGPPIVHAESDLNHDGKDRSPIEGIPGDRFSARWDTCLTLGHSQSVAFQLTSDDSAHLLIDSQQVIDDWEPHARHTRGADVSLEAGVHHLRVDYSQLEGSDFVTLTASFDGERPQRIAPGRLRFPREDAQRPCE